MIKEKRHRNYINTLLILLLLFSYSKLKTFQLTKIILTAAGSKLMRIKFRDLR